MSLCTIKCGICGGYMSRTTTKRGQPYLYCGKCGLGFMVLKKASIEALDTVCENITEADLPPETLRKYQGKQ